MRSIKILFVGCVESSKILLQELIKFDVEIVGVITKDKSDFNSDFYNLAPICVNNNIDYIYVNNINDENSIEYIKLKKPDLIYCFGWSQLISKSMISIPTIGIIGFHPAKLPMNRGRHPIIWALALGLEETASTFFFIEEGADEGDIISQEVINIEYADNAFSLYKKIMNVAVKQVRNFTMQFCNNSIVRMPQANSNSNYWRKRTKEDGKIDWRMSSTSIYNLIRALSKPYVGAHFVHNGREYKVWKSEVISESNKYKNIEYGKVIKVNNDKTFIVKSGDGLIKILKSDDIDIKEGEYLI